MTQEERRVFLIKELLAERPEYQDAMIPAQEQEQRQLLRGLMNVRPPQSISEEFLAVQDAYLQEEARRKGIVTLESLPLSSGADSIYADMAGKIHIWQGDITRLAVDAIVNAANSGMTGCYQPNHACIDNCIHTYAGVQLRQECAKLMERQGHEEPTGKAKLTPAYNLPCRYVLHTVGPIVQRQPTDHDKALLSSCYESCLALATENKLESIAFCCISTGVFHFPNRLAAEIAVSTVRKFLVQKTSVKHVIFNVFKDVDAAIYREIAG